MNIVSCDETITKSYSAGVLFEIYYQHKLEVNDAGVEKQYTAYIDDDSIETNPRNIGIQFEMINPFHELTR